MRSLYFVHADNLDQFWLNGKPRIAQLEQIDLGRRRIAERIRAELGVI